MKHLGTDQYEALKKLALKLFGRDGPYDVPRFLRGIDREVDKGSMPPIFTATPEETWSAYRLNLLQNFFQRWETERFTTEKRRIIGVHNRVERVTAYEVLNGGTPSDDALAAALMYYRQGLTLIGRYAKYTGKDIDAVLTDVRDSMEEPAKELIPA